MRQTTILLLLASCIYSQAQKIDSIHTKNKPKAIKMEFFSPLTGNITMGYEVHVKDGMSWEMKLGAIGAGVDISEMDPSGFLFKIGPKFKLLPIFIVPGTQGAHLLNGRYIRPEIVFSHYREDQDSSYFGSGNNKARETVTSIGFIINYGKQATLANFMTVDYYFGIGYAWDGREVGGYNYGHTNGDSDFPIAAAAGLTIGFLLGN